jgi:hypothetical protein
MFGHKYYMLIRYHIDIINVRYCTSFVCKRYCICIFLFTGVNKQNHTQCLVFDVFRVYLVVYPFSYFELSPIFGIELSPIFDIELYPIFWYWIIFHFVVLSYLLSMSDIAQVLSVKDIVFVYFFLLVSINKITHNVWSAVDPNNSIPKLGDNLFSNVYLVHLCSLFNGQWTNSSFLLILFVLSYLTCSGFIWLFILLVILSYLPFLVLSYLPF